MDKEKEPIVPRMRAMELGEVVYFPIARYNAVRTSIYHGLVPDRAEGKKWKIKLDLDNKRVEVKRTS